MQVTAVAHGESDRAVVLTGASGELGVPIVGRLARPGRHFWLIGRDAAALQRVADAANELGASATCVVADLGDVDAQVRVASEVAAGPPICALIHAAGRNVAGTADATEISEYDDSWRIIVRSAIVLTKGCLRSLESCEGAVIFLNSTRIQQSTAGHSAYAVAKSALKVFADGLREELSPRGVHVSTITLGSMAGDFQRRRTADANIPYVPEALVQPATVAELIGTILEQPRSAEIPDVTLRPGLHPSRRLPTAC